ncbi:hypothetical protein CP556_24795 [Natrinema sp. CBA1119]|uniref:hypothetical protein n=1 Tax=Natrinema sp. CBA1119 TaxID=1608465 RepID=UPI000BF4137F|nr:hypothetical protein [Natrinema sp. CBA1119]PGF14228.1 hypothetical protein CP556_24795 [Natrinema sp. CBA1119]
MSKSEDQGEDESADSHGMFGVGNFLPEFPRYMKDNRLELATMMATSDTTNPVAEMQANFLKDLPSVASLTTPEIRLHSVERLTQQLTASVVPDPSEHIYSDIDDIPDAGLDDLHLHHEIRNTPEHTRQDTTSTELVVLCEGCGARELFENSHRFLTNDDGELLCGKCRSTGRSFS